MGRTEPILCVTGAERTVVSLAARLASAAEGDLHEIRLDLLQGPLDDVWALVERHGSRLIVACRPAWAGGGFAGDESLRLSLLARAAHAGARFIDVEIQSLERDVPPAPADRTLASWHGQVVEPDFPGMAVRLARAPAGAFKAAVTVRDAADLVRLRSWRRDLPTMSSVVGMGAAGLWTRLRPGDLESAWTYVAAGADVRTVPDQPTRAQALAGRVLESARLAPVVLVGGPQVFQSPGPSTYNRLFAQRGEPFQYLAMAAATWADVMALARAFGVTWFSVTRPFKRDAFLAAPWADPWARRAGVANTVRLHQGQPEACWNTDVPGFLGAVAEWGPLDGLNALILGAGDTAQALASGVRFAGGRVTLACRNPEPDARRTPEEGADANPRVVWGERVRVPHDLLVQATPLDGRDGDAPWPAEVALGASCVVDVVLPVAGPTRLVSGARQAGLPAVDGLEFWIRQGMTQAGLVTHRTVTFRELAGALDVAWAAGRLPASGPDDPAGGIQVPGSKSLTQRSLVLAALADGPSRLTGVSPGADSQELARALEMLGAGVLPCRDGVCVLPRELRSHDVPIPCGQGGTTARFVAAMTLAIPGDVALMLAPPMGDRPMEGLVAALRQAGKSVSLERHADGGGVLRVSGPAFDGGRLDVDASVSSQFASGLLLVGAILPRGLEITIPGTVVSSAYLDLTVVALRQFGVKVAPIPGGWRVTPGRPRATDLRIEGDWSLGAFWRVAHRIAGPGPRVAGLDPASVQADRRVEELLDLLDGPGDRRIDLEDVPDLLPPLAIAALFREGATTFAGIGHTRFKESDRPRVLARELGKVGANLSHGDGVLRVAPTPLTGPALLDPHDDHRMAMAFGVLSLAVPGITIADRQCVRKSYPGFFDDLAVWRTAAERQGAVPPSGPLVLVGMRGVGKSTVGRLLAARLGRPFVDSDDLVQARLGVGIRELFHRGDVPAFRRCEAEVIRGMLGRDVVLATGGGCVEDPDTVRALAGVFTAWLDCPVGELARRVGASDRPSVTGSPPAGEVAGLAQRRAPGYAACARIRVDAGDNDAEAVCDAIERAWRSLPDPDLR